MKARRGSAAIIVLVALVLVGLVLAYQGHQSHQRELRREQERREQARREERARVEAAEREREARLRAAEREREARQREERQAAEQAEARREAAKRAELAAERARLAAESAQREHYREAMGRFAVAVAARYEKAPREERPTSGVAAATFWYADAEHLQDHRIYELRMVPGGANTALVLRPDDPPAEVAASEVLNRLETVPGVLTDGKRVWLCGLGTTAEVPVPEEGGEIVPSELLFCELNPLLEVLAVQLPEWQVRVTLKSECDKTEVEMGVLPYTETIPYDQMLDALSMAAIEALGKKKKVVHVPKPKFKSYQPKVVLFGGGYITTDKNGIVMVPRQCPTGVSNAYLYKYQRLRAEAENEQRQVDACREENRKLQEEYELKLARANGGGFSGTVLREALAECRLCMEYGEKLQSLGKSPRISKELLAKREHVATTFTRRCDKCKGRGWDYVYRDCTKCGGSGFLRDHWNRLDGPCDMCKNAPGGRLGKLRAKQTCPDCDGKGKIETSR